MSIKSDIEDRGSLGVTCDLVYKRINARGWDRGLAIITPKMPSGGSCFKKPPGHVRASWSGRKPNSPLTSVNGPLIVEDGS